MKSKGRPGEINIIITWDTDLILRFRSRSPQIYCETEQDKFIHSRFLHGCKILDETILNDWLVDIELSRNRKRAKIWWKRVFSCQEVEWSTRSLSVRLKLLARKVIKIRKCWEWIRQGICSIARGIECEYWCMSCEACKSDIFGIPWMG